VILFKSINEKYKDLSGDEDKLLTQERLQERLDNDKRQVRYVINPEKYKKISSLLASNGKK